MILTELYGYLKLKLKQIHFEIQKYNNEHLFVSTSMDSNE